MRSAGSAFCRNYERTKVRPCRSWQEFVQVTVYTFDTENVSLVKKKSSNLSLTATNHGDRLCVQCSFLWTSNLPPFSSWLTVRPLWRVFQEDHFPSIFSRVYELTAHVHGRFYGLDFVLHNLPNIRQIRHDEDNSCRFEDKGKETWIYMRTACQG